MKTEVQEWIDFAIQHLSAESYLDGLRYSNEYSLKDLLLRGANNWRVEFDQDHPHNTRMLEWQADWFVKNYDVVHHLPNRSSGFSATLIRERGTNRYTLSMRSTEYRNEDKGGDWRRDGAPGADGEIAGGGGFALAQLASMEDYYEYLRGEGLLPVDATLFLTGYSLSGQLATVFTMLHPDVVEKAYTFNGVGLGGYDSSIGSLRQMIDHYRALVRDPASAGEPSEERLLEYWRNALHESLPDDVGNVTAAISLVPDKNELPNLYETSRHKYAALDTMFEYRLVNTTLVDSDRVLEDEISAKVVQIYGHGRHGDVEIVANRGINSSQERRVLIEDQPDASAAGGFGGLPGDYGTSHSIILIIDALATIELFQSIDPGLTQQDVETILIAASNARASGYTIDPAGRAEANTFESALDALRRLFLDEDVDPTPWNDKTGDYGDVSNRNRFYQNIADLKAALPATPLKVVPLQTDDLDRIVAEAAADTADGLGYRYALTRLNPFAVLGDEEIYAQHNVDGSLDLFDPVRGAGALTSAYLEDRAALLRQVLWRANEDTDHGQALPGDAYDRFWSRIDPARYRDLAAQIRLGDWSANAPMHLFGDAGGNELVGGDEENHLYGGHGDDTLAGGAGYDRLEGGAGDDRYIVASGQGPDTILDSDGRGRLLLDGERLSGGNRVGEGVYRSVDGRHLYLFDGMPGERGILWIDGTVRIEEFRSGDLGVELNEQPFDDGGPDRPLFWSEKPDLVEPPSVDLFGHLRHFAGEGNDFMWGTVGSDWLHGGEGGDVIAPGLEGDVVYGGAGDDLVFSGSGPDLVVGGLGDDIVINSHFNHFTTADGSGFDRYWPDVGYRYEAETVPGVVIKNDGHLEVEYRYRPPSVSFAGESFLGRDRFVYDADQWLVSYDIGSADPLLIRLQQIRFDTPDDHSSNLLAGEAGADLLSGAGGPDRIHGGEDDDSLVGEAGNDLLVGASGADVLLGGPGADLLDGGNGGDLLYGGDGDDHLWGGPGDDELTGDDPDRPESVQGDDLLRGGEGEDRLWGLGGADRLFGGTGDDHLWGGAGADRLEGGAGNDRLLGDDPDAPGGSDILIGGAGDDLLEGHGGDDLLTGGSGNDRLVGGTGDDWLHGAAGGDWLVGNHGDDRYLVFRGDGIDVIDDDAGNDTLFLPAEDPIRARMITGTDGVGYLDIEYGNDDHVYIAHGLERAVEWFQLNQTADASSDAGPLTLGGFLGRYLRQSVEYRLSGPGELYGGAGDDTLVGSTGDDALHGGDGDDILAGGAGDDLLVGGEGRDSYRVGWGTGLDRIVERDGGANVLHLFAGLEVGRLGFRREGDDLCIGLDRDGGRDGVILDGFYASEQVWRLEDESGGVRQISATEPPEEAMDPMEAMDEAMLQQIFLRQAERSLGGLLRQQGYHQEVDGVFSWTLVTDNHRATYRITLRESQTQASGGVLALDPPARRVRLQGESMRTETVTLPPDPAARLQISSPSGRGHTYLDLGMLENGWRPGTGIEIGGYTLPVFTASAAMDALTGQSGRLVVGYDLYPAGDPGLGERRLQTLRERDYTGSIDLDRILGSDRGDTIWIDPQRTGVVQGGRGDDRIQVVAGGLAGSAAWNHYGGEDTLTLPDGRRVASAGISGMMLAGGEGDDLLVGGYRDDLLTGGPGSDYLAGGEGEDTYQVLQRDDGIDLVFDDGWEWGGRGRRDLLILPEGVSPDDLDLSWGSAVVESLHVSGNWHGRAKSVHRVLHLRWGDEAGVDVVLPHSDQGAGLGLDRIRFADGTLLPFSRLVSEAGGADLDPQRQGNRIEASGVIDGDEGDDTLVLVSSPVVSAREGEYVEGPGEKGGGPTSLSIGGGGTDLLIGGLGADVLIGGQVIEDWSDDSGRLIGGLWDQGNSFRGGGGADLLWATAGPDRFEFGLGDGWDRITDLVHDRPYRRAHRGADGTPLIEGEPIDTDALAWIEDQLVFDPGIQPSDIGLERAGDDLLIRHRNGTDGIRMVAWFDAPFNQLGRIEFADGTVWSRQEMERLLRGEPLNRPPQVTATLDPQRTEEERWFRIDLPQGLFVDPDAGDQLRLTLAMADGSPLPEWVRLSDDQRRIEGRPGLDDAGDYSLRLQATDPAGLSVDIELLLRVADVNPPIVGGAGNERLGGTRYPDVVDGGDGDDRLQGGEGDDTLIGGTGSDLLEGGPGDDLLHYGGDDRWSGGFHAYNAGSPGRRGSGARVRIAGLGRSFDRFDGGDGHDTLVATDGDDGLFLDDGFSRAPDGVAPRFAGIERFELGAGNDVLDLTSRRWSMGSVTALGDAGDDVIWTSAGDDLLRGGAGDDRLFGGVGDDTLDGGSGDDRLQGWLGDDIYLIGAGDGRTRIRERGGSDTLRFGDGFEAGRLWFRADRGDLEISRLGGGERVRIEGWYRSPSSRVERFEAGGELLLSDQVDRLVQAMAAFEPGGGIGRVPPEQMPEPLAPQIAAAWTPLSG